MEDKSKLIEAIRNVSSVEPCNVLDKLRQRVITRLAHLSEPSITAQAYIHLVKEEVGHSRLRGYEGTLGLSAVTEDLEGLNPSFSEAIKDFCWEYSLASKD